jgi:hypothetical protein
MSRAYRMYGAMRDTQHLLFENARRRDYSEEKFIDGKII